MAVTSLRGLMPIHTPCCGIETNKYRIEPGTTKLFIGDPAIKNPGGTVTIGGVTEALLGAFMEFFDADGVPQGFYPGGSEEGWICVIADGPGQHFMIAEDDGSMTLADIGTGANLVSGVGDEVSNMSKWKLDSSSAGGTAGTEQLVIVDFVDMISNEIGDTNAQWHVRINLHENANNATPV